MKLKKILLYVLLFVVLLGSYLLYWVAPTFILQPVRVERKQLDEQAGFLEVKVPTQEGFLLDGAHFRLNNPKAVVVLLHGVGSSKEIWDEEMKWLADQNIASFAFDNRGQGRSGGEYVTYGHLETDDLSRIADLMAVTYPGVPLGIWGYSLGGAVALQSLAVEKRWAFGIVESTFSRLDQTVRAYQKRISKGFGVAWLADFVLYRAGKMAGFDPQKIVPMEAAKQITVPVFHAHGEADMNISPENALAIHQRLNHPDKELVLVPGADHSGLYAAGGEDYLARMAAFLRKVLD